MEWIKVFSPATVANIGPGFDVLGMAVKGMGDVVEARRIPQGVTISSIESLIPLSTDPALNTAGIAASEVLKKIGNPGGVELRIKKGISPGSGLGSSAASAAAGAFAANFLYGSPLSKEGLILPATVAEAAVSGDFFADNTAPALLGGATLTRSVMPLDVTKIGKIDALKIVLVTPNTVLLTKNARAVLPEMVPLKSFVANMANACLITAAFAKNDYGLFARSVSDVIVEPARAHLIKGFYDVKQSALAAGADGMSISGAGATVFAVTDSKEKGERIRDAMIGAFSKHGVKSSGIVTELESEGTKILE